MPKLKFVGSDLSKMTDHTIEVFNNTHNEIFIRIDVEEYDNPCGWIALDIDTAIQFSKQLRKSIANAKSF